MKRIDPMAEEITGLFSNIFYFVMYLSFSQYCWLYIKNYWFSDAYSRSTIRWHSAASSASVCRLVVCARCSGCCVLFPSSLDLVPAEIILWCKNRPAVSSCVPGEPISLAPNWFEVMSWPPNSEEPPNS